MDTNLLSASIGAISALIVAGLGWLVAGRQADRTRKREAALLHLESQIGELYGPLLGLITHSRTISGVKKKLLLTSPEGETGNFRGGTLDVEVARFFERRYSFPVNEEIRKLIASKMHLLDSMILPDSFREFLEHAAEYECLHELWRATGEKVQADEGYQGVKIVRKRWPNDFEADVQATLQRLRENHRRFLEQVSQTGGSAWNRAGRH